MDEPMTAERRAEIRQRANAAVPGPWTVEDLHVVAGDDPAALVQIADFEWLADTDEEWKEFERNAAFVAAAREDVPALVAEVERLRAKLARDHDELRDKRTDLLNVRGILKPAPGVGEPAVPMPLGDMVAPAVEWLVQDRDRLAEQIEAVRVTACRLERETSEEASDG